MKLAKKILYFFYHKTKTPEKNIYTFFGIKFSHKLYLPDKKTIKKVIDCKKVPMKSDGNFYIFKNFPIKSKDVKLSSRKFDSCNISIILQGPIIKQDDFTFETLKIYKKIFNNGEKIILSTWDNEDENIIKKIKDLGIFVVLSTPPIDAGRANLNFQIVSSQNGIKKAKELSCDYVMKTRCDQRIYAENTSAYLMNLLKLFPVNNKNLNSRIITLSFNSFLYRFYGASDMFQFGHVDDVEKYWNIPFDKFDEKMLDGLSRSEIIRKHCSETYIVSNFLKNLGKNPDFTLDDSLDVYRDIFLFVDKEQLDFYWPKYTNQDSRWRLHKNNLLKEIKFSDWLGLYCAAVNYDEINKELTQLEEK